MDDPLEWDEFKVTSREWEEGVYLSNIIPGQIVKLSHSELRDVLDKWMHRQIVYEPTSDPIVNEVINLLKARSARGMETYGQPMTRKDISAAGWCDHTIEELLDAACYLMRLRRDISNNNNNWYNNNAVHGDEE